MPIIDNPGGGDCGFYAFAIGLIEILQKEHDQNKTAAGESLFPYLPTGVQLEDVRAINLDLLKQNPTEYKRELLDKLQMALRTMVLAASRQELEEKISIQQAMGSDSTAIGGASLFGKFRELVVHFSRGQQDISLELAQYNELALSEEVLDLARQTAANLPTSNALTTSEQREKQELEHVQAAFLADIRDPSSVILEGAKKITQQGRWATHSDLQVLAAQFKVNLCINGQNNGTPEANWETITLQNHDNVHWTTHVTEVGTPVIELAASDSSVLSDDFPHAIENVPQFLSDLSPTPAPLRTEPSSCRQRRIRNSCYRNYGK